MNRSWSDRLYRLLKSSCRNKLIRPARPVSQLNCEFLEDRCVPAISIISGANGSGTLDSTFTSSGGQITAAQSTDNGADSFTLSFGALQSIASATNINITSDSITFNFTSTALQLPTGLGATAAFTATGFNPATSTATGGAITFADDVFDSLLTFSGSLSFDANTTLDLGNLTSNEGNIGLTAGSNILVRNINANGGTVNVLSSGGSVTQGGFVSAGSYAVNASTSINVLGELTSTNNGTIGLTAGSDIGVQDISAGTGSVNITSNGGSVTQFGAGSANSYSVSATTGISILGNLSSTSSGSFGDISLTDGISGTPTTGISVVGISAGNGNVGMVEHNGPITQTGAGSSSFYSVSASGNVSLNSVRGSTVTIISRGSIQSSAPLQSSTQLSLSAATGITVQTIATTLQATNSTSGDINVTQLGTTPPVIQVLTTTGPGITNNAAGGTINIDNENSSITVAAGANITSNNGNITLLGTGFLITGTVNAGTGTVILGNSIAAATFDVGTKSANNIGLVQAELNNVTASDLQIGTANAGNINISAAITTPPNAPVITLETGAFVTEGGSGSLALTNLRVLAGGAATLTNSTNNIGTIAASTGGAFSVNNGTNTLTVGTVAGTSGITTNNSTVTLQADNLLIHQVVTPGTATAVLEPFTTGLNITLGTASVSGSTFGLTNAALGWVTSGVTQVGVSADTGSIAITGAITRTPTMTAPSRSQTLSLVTGSTATNPMVSSTTGAITQTAALSVANLVTNTVGGVQLTGSGNTIDTVAAAITGTATGVDLFRLVDGAALTVGTVAGTAGISVGGTQAAELTTTGALTLTNGVSAGGIGLSAGGAVTQGAGGALVASEAEFLGTGPYTLTTASNSIGNLAASVTGAISYANTGALTVSSFTASDGFGGTVTGVTTSNAPIALSATGTLGLNNAVNAGTGAVNLTGTSIINGASAGTPVVIGSSLVVSGTTGVGTSAAPLVTTVATLGGSGGTGGVFVTNTAALALNTVTVVGAGNIQISTAGTGTGLNLTVNATQIVSAPTSNITLTSAGNLSVNGTIISPTGHITLAGSSTTTGTTITLANPTVLSSINTVQIQGTSAADTFNLVPQAATALAVTGGTPTTAPGDALNVTGDTGTALNSTGVGAGSLTFTNGSGITFTGIETLNTATPIAVTLNLATLGFQQGSTSPDVVSVSTTAGGVLNVTVQENNTGTPVSIYSALATGVSSLTITGSTDRQTFIVDETNAGVPAVTVNGTGPANETLVVYTTNTTSPTFTPGGSRAGTVTFGNRNTITYSAIDNVDTSVVTVVASTPGAVVTPANQTAQPGVFTFTRTGNLSSALTVNYTLSGSAVNGSSYQTLSGQVTFAAGSATATVNVNPNFTSVVGSTKTVDVTLAAGSGYAVLNPTSAEVTITNPNNELNNTVAVAGRTGVTVYRNGTAVLTNYNPGFTAPITVAVGDLTGDGVPDIVMAGLVNGTDWVAVIDGATLTLQNAFIPVPGYGGGLSLATGYIFGGGHADIVVGLSTAPAYGVFDGQSDGLVGAVIVFPGVNVGVNVATADLQGNGIDDVIATPNGIAPIVSIYNGAGDLINRFAAFNPAIAGVGLTVAAGDIQNTGTDELIFGVQINGFDYALVYNSNLTQRAILPLAAAASSAPPQVGTGSLTGDGIPDLLVTVGGIFAAFDGDTLGLTTVLAPFPGQPGPIYVG